ncbi:MAG TPA: diphthine--ammonia ligase [Ohtaekwangia sp.]|uniref:Dph6-related ATP pyrophosphatase n=1 Tax=Ohtaekwangia sp. TaxID=2066019 RepID=UPI002F92417D
MKNFFSSWSGGKDSCFAFMQAIAQDMQPCVLLNMMNENGMVSRSHAIPKDILLQQAAMLNLPMITRPASWEGYEKIFIETLHTLKADFGIQAGVFGDIDLQPHRDWEEKVCSAAGIEAILPLWLQDRKTLVYAMLEAGIETYIVSCNETMGERFLGKKITHALVDELEAIGIDACGENGEYHTLVVYTPMFKKRINVVFGATRCHNQYWFIEMKLA